MNILYVMLYWPVYGGGETVTATLANEMVRRGHKVHISYSIYNKPNELPYVIDERISEVLIDASNAANEEDISKMHRYIVANNIEILISQWSDIIFCDKARKGTNCKLIKCCHVAPFMYSEPITKLGRVYKTVFGNKAFNRHQHGIQLRSHIDCFKLSDKYIFLSESYLNEIKAEKINAALLLKGCVIPNPQTYESTIAPKIIEEKKNEILFVGRIYEYPKRLSLAIKIWAKVVADTKYDNWIMRVVGEGPDLDYNKQIANNLGLTQISFEGFQDPKPFYKDASIFMMTSIHEGFGMTLIEAQHYGVVPIAMNSYTTLHDIVTNGQNGIIVENNDEHGYADAIRELIDNEVRRRKLAISSMESSKKFSLKNIADKWESLFSDLK